MRVNNDASAKITIVTPTSPERRQLLGVTIATSAISLHTLTKLQLQDACLLYIYNKDARSDNGLSRKF